MATKNQIDAVWTNGRWLGIAPRPCLVDYSGLKVRRSFSAALAGQPGYRPIALLFAAILFLSILLVPIPASLIATVDATSPSAYGAMEFGGETSSDITEYRKCL